MPFAVFRRYQKSLMAGLAIFAMFAFSFDIFFNRMLGPRSKNQDPIVARAYGKDVHASDLARFQTNRQVANIFMTRLYQAFPLQFIKYFQSVSHGSRDLLSRLSQIQQQGYFGGTDIDSALDALILEHKADELGIAISADNVTGFLREITQDSLTARIFEDLRNELRGHPTARRLLDILAEQRRLQLMENLAGLPEITPAQVFALYRKITEERSAELVDVPVSSFTADVADPLRRVLAAFYAAHKDQLPDPASPTPGFEEPRRVMVQYIAADLAKFEPEPVLERDLVAYYQEHKQLFAPPPPSPPSSLAPPARPPNAEKTQAIEPVIPAHPLAPEPGAPSKSTAAGSPTGRAATSKPAPPQRPTRSTTAPGGPPLRAVEPEPPAPSLKIPVKPIASEPAKKPPAKTPALAEEIPAAVRPEVYERFVQEQARQRIEDAFTTIRKVMDHYSNEYYKTKARSERVKGGEDLPPPPPPDLRALAEQFHMEFMETSRPVTREEAEHLPRIGSAYEHPQDSSSFTPFAKLVFESESAVFTPHEVEDFETMFLFWVTKDIAAHAPPFADLTRTQRDAVLAAWKIEQARPLARTYAQDLAQRVQAVLKKSGTAAVNDPKRLRTELENLIAAVRAKAGKGKQPPALRVVTTGPFRQLRIDVPNSPTNPRDPLQHSPGVVPGVPFPTSEMLDKLFHLEPGKVTIVSNSPESDFYVAAVDRIEEARFNAFQSDPRMTQMEATVYQENAAETNRNWMRMLRQEANLTILPRKAERDEDRSSEEAPSDSQGED